MTNMEPQTFRSDTLPRDLPFPAAVRAGDTIYVSGSLGHRPGTHDVVPGGVGPQMHQAMENMREAVELAGSTLERVLKCTVFIADMADYEAMNEVYVTFFHTHQPARSTVAVKGLAFGALVEIECIALAG